MMSTKYTGPMEWPDTRRPTNQWQKDDGTGLVHLNDLDYDFEDYFHRFNSGGMDEDERRDFSARVYGLFCRDFFKSGGTPAALEFWVVEYIANRLLEALGGVRWEDIMGLPWDEPTPVFTPRGKRAFDIYAGVKNTLLDRPDARITELIEEQAALRHVSYETARADYYAMKAAMDAGTGIPRNFLNSEVDL